MLREKNAIQDIFIHELAKQCQPKPCITVRSHDMNNSHRISHQYIIGSQGNLRLFNSRRYGPLCRINVQPNNDVCFLVFVFFFFFNFSDFLEFGSLLETLIAFKAPQYILRTCI